MVDLKTTYMGIELKNPIIAASCGLVSTAKGVKKAEDAGAGAVILKSLFEEQIRMETSEAAAGVEGWDHPEARAYLQTEVWMQYGPRDYCRLIEESKKNVSIPIFASVNCISGKWWTDYAKEMESAGADGIELNILIPGTDPEVESSEIEKTYKEIVRKVSSQVKIPVAAKIGFNFASVSNITKEIVDAGANGLVLFNRFHMPDMDIDSLTLKHASPFSTPADLNYSLRWIGLLSGSLDCDFAATTGIHEAEQVVKQILAGATVTQVCSTLYKNGFEQIGKIIEGLEKWMEDHSFDSLDDFRGKLSHKKAEKAAIYERRQYIKHLVEIH